MKIINRCAVVLLVCCSIAFSQNYEIHHRGMMRQTIYSTGELGKRLIRKVTSIPSPFTPSFEWPKATDVWDPSTFPLSINLGTLNTNLSGFNNCFGGGIWIAADTTIKGTWQTSRALNPCGAITQNKGGQEVPVDEFFSFPLSIQRWENYPINSTTGVLNLSYDPNKPEEKIVASWNTPLGLTITSTSYAWSYPGYNSFIIIEYELENTGARSATGRPDTLREMLIAFPHVLAPSMFSLQVENANGGLWDEALTRTQKYMRFNWTRYMCYVHTYDGRPVQDPTAYDTWGRTGLYGGGLMAPAAVGILPLYYDTTHLEKRGQMRTRIFPSSSTQPNYLDSAAVWDSHNHLKQPYTIHPQHGNLDYNFTDPKNAPNSFAFLNCESNRYDNPFWASNSDTVLYPEYWRGRGNMNLKNSGIGANQSSTIYALGPYILYPGEKMRFTIAEVAGYGPSGKGDSVVDVGGGNGGEAVAPRYHQVLNWYNTISFDDDMPTASNLSSNRGDVGSNYLSNYPLPWYVDTPVVSIRDVADRAIQMYTGWPLIKYESSQFEPMDAPPQGVYNSVAVPCPAPKFTVKNTIAASNQILWGTEIEVISPSNPIYSRYHGALKCYVLKRMAGKNLLGQWETLDTIARQDPRYLSNSFPRTFENGKYVFVDQTSQLNTWYYYAIISIDSLDGKSGLTNLTLWNTQRPAVSKMGKVYAAPNPFIVQSNYADDAFGAGSKIGIFGLPKHATIRIFSYSGQLVQTIEHNADFYSTEWFQASRNGQWIASGVYFFTVEDHDTGDRAWNKFVVIH